LVTIDDVSKRLNHFGYTTNDDDKSQIEFELDKWSKYILNYCNISEIPEMVYPRLIDRVCAEFLFNKKNSGTLEGFDYDAVIKSIKEGDTTITYEISHGESIAETRFDALVKQLERGFDKWLTPYRRLRW